MKKQIKPTLLDFAILGLLRENPLSGYRIRKQFEESALGNYSSSPGTIYPALKRLEKFGLVEKPVESGKTNPHFLVTPKGISILKDWLLKPIEKKEVEKYTDALLLKFAFMETLTDKKQKIAFLTSFRDLQKMYIQDLQEYYNKEAHDMPLHGKLALLHGIDTNKATLKWCKKALTQLI